MIISQINDQEVIYFDPQRCPDTHCITKNHLLCMCFFEFVTCCVSVKYVSLTAVEVCRGISAYLTSSVSMVYCTCQFRCLYFTHFKLQFCEAVEQIATVKLLSPVCFCTVKLSVSI